MKALVPWERHCINYITWWRKPIKPSINPMGGLAFMPKIRFFLSSSLIGTFESKYWLFFYETIPSISTILSFLFSCFLSIVDLFRRTWLSSLIEGAKPPILIELKEMFSLKVYLTSFVANFTSLAEFWPTLHLIIVCMSTVPQVCVTCDLSGSSLLTLTLTISLPSLRARGNSSP